MSVIDTRHHIPDRQDELEAAWQVQGQLNLIGVISYVNDIHKVVSHPDIC